MTAITYAQTFCTVADLVADAQAPGADETRMFQAISEACAYLQKRIGWFIPVTLTRYFNGKDLEKLLVPPLLAISAISNDGTLLTAADYILKPDEGFWPYGPFSEVNVNPESNILLRWTGEINAVEITGRWGKYERSAAIGATVADTTQQDASQLTLKVSNGAKASPGMVLLVGSEQEHVTGWGDPTSSITLCSSAVAVADEYITVVDASLVNIGEIIRLEFEQCRVKDTNTTNDRLSVIRGWNGTNRVTHAISTPVDVYRTVSVVRGVNGTTAVVHANGVAISRYLAPEDVQYLTKEIAYLMVNKAKSNYQGRTGNQDTGMVFYNDALPEYDIRKIEEQYSFRSIS